MLREGGSAADAAIAVQLVLNLVEPQSSGIGGGGFVLYWNAAAKKLETYDGRETAPAAAKPDRFMAGGRPMQLGAAIFGGASVGVPGTVRLLEAIHKAHGRLPWARLLQPAIRLAEQGFRVSPRLNLPLCWYGAQRRPPARNYFRCDWQRAPTGTAQEPELAATPAWIAEKGAGAL
jgi:gamma-glutamyltranspeptidase/glutathione hydrolase